MTNASNILVAILNLEILFNFSVKVLRFTDTNKNTEYNTKFTLREGPKIYVLNFIFSWNLTKIWEITKVLIKLNHLKIGISKL